jgi:hypothetical protein
MYVKFGESAPLRAFLFQHLTRPPGGISIYSLLPSLDETAHCTDDESRQQPPDPDHEPTKPA